MPKSPQRVLHVHVAAILCLAACEAGTPPRTEAAYAAPTVLRVTILGDSRDFRVPLVREALVHWNAEATRLGLAMRFDSGSVRPDSVPEDALRRASRAMPWGGAGVLRLRGALSSVPGDVIIALAQNDLISFGATLVTGRVGVIALRPADRWPLSLPNTMRNVVAHELGHVLGLEHNADSTTLMCGRPAACRPSAFISPTPRFFPITPADEQQLKQRWR